MTIVITLVYERCREYAKKLEPTVTIRGHLAQVLGRISTGWIPTFGNKHKVKSFIVDNQDLSSIIHTIIIKDDKLFAYGILRPENESDYLALRGSVTGTLEGDIKFSAGDSLTKAWRTKSGSDEIVIECYYWRMDIENKDSLTWVTNVAGALNDIKIFGNLTISTPQMVSSLHLRLNGQYAYYLISSQSNERKSAFDLLKQTSGMQVRKEPSCWYLLIDTGIANSIDREILYADFLILQFVLGQRLQIETLCGVDEQGVCVSQIGGQLGGSTPKGRLARPPIPLDSFNVVWVASLFKSLSTAYQQHKSLKLFLPLHDYLLSIAEFSDEEHMLLHKGIEAFSWKILEWANRTSEVSSIVSMLQAMVGRDGEQLKSRFNQEHFDDWVNELTGQNVFLSKQITLRAFEACKLQVPALWTQVLDGMQEITHVTEPADDRHLEMLRIILVALLAKFVGYQGEIIGWSQGAQLDLPAIDWWHVSPSIDSEALISYKAVMERESPRAGTVYLGVEDSSSAQIVKWILEAAKIPLERLSIFISYNQTTELERLQGTVCFLMDSEKSSVPDAISDIKQRLPKATKIFCAVPMIEAWLFADDELARHYAVTLPESNDFLQRLPLPEEIPDPRHLARSLFGLSWQTWKFLRFINISRAAARSPSLRDFLLGLYRILEIEPTLEITDSVSRSISRDVLASLIAEVLPSDTVIWRTADGVNYTASEIRQGIESGSEVGRQYASDLLRISREFLMRRSRHSDK